MRVLKKKKCLLALFLALAFTAGCSENSLDSPGQGTRESVTPVPTEADSGIKKEPNVATTHPPNLSPDSSPNKAEEILETGKRKEVARRLLEQFKTSLNKLENAEGTYLDMVTAADAANGLQLFQLSKETLQWLSVNSSKLKDPLKESPIFTGYSKSGVHFIAIAQPFNQGNAVFADAIHTIRNDSREMELFETIANMSYRREVDYLPIDMFAEDLFEKQMEHPVNISVLDDGMSHKLLTQPYQDHELDFIKTNYQRELNFDNIIANKSWHLFFFDNATDQPQIVIHYDGETINLKHGPF